MVEIGGIQGLSETPAIFNLLIRYVLRDVVPEWANHNLAFVCDGTSVSHFCWADNIYLMARSWTAWKVMAHDLSSYP